MLGNLTKTLCIIGRKAGKHAPAVMVVGGIAAAGATVYFAIKAKDKVDSDFEKMEERKSEGEEIKTTELVATVAKDVAIPVGTGVIAVCLFVGSYCIMNNRVKGLSAALAGSMAQYQFLRDKIKDEYGEEKLKDLEEPVKVIEKAQGKRPRKVEKANLKSKQNGFWYCQADEYLRDDYGYNVAYLEEMNRKLTERITRTGYLSLNYILDQFGLPRTPEGAVLGFTDETWAGLSWEAITCGQDPLTGEVQKELYVSWNPMDLKFIYNTPEYDALY